MVVSAHASIGFRPAASHKTFRIQERACPASGPQPAPEGLFWLLCSATPQCFKSCHCLAFAKEGSPRLRPLFSAPGNLAPFGHAGARSSRNLTGLGGTGGEPLTSLAHREGCVWRVLVVKLVCSYRLALFCRPLLLLGVDAGGFCRIDWAQMTYAEKQTGKVGMRRRWCVRHCCLQARAKD